MGKEIQTEPSQNVLAGVQCRLLGDLLSGHFKGNVLKLTPKGIDFLDCVPGIHFLFMCFFEVF